MRFIQTPHWASPIDRRPDAMRCLCLRAVSVSAVSFSVTSAVSVSVMSRRSLSPWCICGVSAFSFSERPCHLSVEHTSNETAIRDDVPHIPGHRESHLGPGRAWRGPRGVWPRDRTCRAGTDSRTHPWPRWHMTWWSALRLTPTPVSEPIKTAGTARCTDLPSTGFTNLPT